MEITFHPFDPELAHRFAAAWRQHPGDPHAIRAELRDTFPHLGIDASAHAGWHVYRDETDLEAVEVLPASPKAARAQPVTEAATAPPGEVPVARA